MAEEEIQPFHGRLSEEQKNWLAATIGPRPKSFRLLYSAQRDICSPDAFHRQCHKKGPTVTVLYNLNDTIYGGYTSKSWRQADGEYEPDSLAFLFQLKKDRLSSFKKIPCIDKEHAIYHDQTKAAVFGRGHDLHLMNRPTAPGKLGTFALDGEINFLSYFLENVDKAEFCNDTLEVTEIEVYSVSVSDAPVSPLSEGKLTVSSTEEEETQCLPVTREEILSLLNAYLTYIWIPDEKTSLHVIPRPTSLIKPRPDWDNILKHMKGNAHTFPEDIKKYYMSLHTADETLQQRLECIVYKLKLDEKISEKMQQLIYKEIPEEAPTDRAENLDEEVDPPATTKREENRDSETYLPVTEAEILKHVDSYLPNTGDWPKIFKHMKRKAEKRLPVIIKGCSPQITEKTLQQREEMQPIDDKEIEEEQPDLR